MLSDDDSRLRRGLYCPTRGESLQESHTHSQERPKATSDQVAFDPPARLPKVRSGAYMGLALYF